MKKIIVSLLSITLIACLILGGCSAVKYGDSFDTLSELKSEIEKDGAVLLYSSYYSELDDKDLNMKYISIYDRELKKNVGYKIYCFSNDFNSAVYAYTGLKDVIQCEDESKLTYIESFTLNDCEVKLFSGPSQSESIFLISRVNINGNHYEVRVVGNNSKEGGVYVNHIKKDNENYPLAINIMKDIILSLK